MLETITSTRCEDIIKARNTLPITFYISTKKIKLHSFSTWFTIGWTNWHIMGKPIREPPINFVPQRITTIRPIKGPVIHPLTKHSFKTKLVILNPNYSPTHTTFTLCKSHTKKTRAVADPVKTIWAVRLKTCSYNTYREAPSGLPAKRPLERLGFSVLWGIYQVRFPSGLWIPGFLSGFSF